MSETKPSTLPVKVGAAGLAPESYDELKQVARAFFESSGRPRGLESVADVFLVLQAGAEAGLPPVASLRSIYIVNGTPSWGGAAALAKIRQSGEAKLLEMGHSGEDDDYHAWIRVQRHDMSKPETVKYSVKDAKTAGLWGKKTRTGQPTPWITAPDDMLLWRCVGRVSKRYFSGTLLGMEVAEVARDYKPIEAESSHDPPPDAPDPLLASPGDAGEVVDAEFKTEPLKRRRRTPKPLASQKCEADGCEEKAVAFFGSGKCAACDNCGPEHFGERL